MRNVEKTVGPRVLECLRAGEERRKEKLETRDGDSCEVRRKRVRTRERERGGKHMGRREERGTEKLLERWIKRERD